jgi:endonuclease/exonuclease/phosphatase family metal-dependent hydrolase
LRKSALLVYAALIGGGIWFFLQNFSIEGLEGLLVKKKQQDTGETFPVGTPGPEVPAYQPGETIKIAAFNIQVFGQSKLNKPRAMDILARIVRQFDIVAIQEIRSRDQDVVPRFIELINAAGRSYDYVIGPRLGDTSSKEQYAFIFDRQSIEVDRRFVYTIDDPDNLLHREPLVAWFRVRGPTTDETFTFTLVNIHTDPDLVPQELAVMDDVYSVVRDDGRNEDDVIILGDLNADDRHFGELGQVPGITWAISGIPTNVRQTKQYDNLVFHSQATREFVGRSGVVDFMRQYNLSSEEALEISDHFPVWAEFSIYEGGTAAHIATRPGATTTR